MAESNPKTSTLLLSESAFWRTSHKTLVKSPSLHTRNLDRGNLRRIVLSKEATDWRSGEKLFRWSTQKQTIFFSARTPQSVSSSFGHEERARLSAFEHGTATSIRRLEIADDKGRTRSNAWDFSTGRGKAAINLRAVSAAELSVTAFVFSRIHANASIASEIVP